MNVTKYEHACFSVEKDDRVIVVDPGLFTTDFIAPSDVVAIVITHEHGDHFDPELISAIIDKSPEAVIIGDASITNQIDAFETRPVSAGDTLEVGPFHLEFFGGQHATIHDSMPTPPNLGVMIDELLYYPGDSFYIPEDHSIDTLALPVAAPWLKISEAMDFLTTVHPRIAFPTHDAILSSIGQDLVDRMIGGAAAKNDIVYTREASITV
ncbi:MAG TPA: MBL fold metallo-hydrolase [Candidatus Saccharimonadales bacterium]